IRDFHVTGVQTCALPICRIVAIYTIAAVFAGFSGALLTQTTSIVALDVLAFHRSADVLLVLVLGGVGYLYGGIVGAILFTILRRSEERRGGKECTCRW